MLELIGPQLLMLLTFRRKQRLVLHGVNTHPPATDTGGQTDIRTDVLVPCSVASSPISNASVTVTAEVTLSVLVTYWTAVLRKRRLLMTAATAPVLQRSIVHCYGQWRSKTLRGPGSTVTWRPYLVPLPPFPPIFLPYLLSPLLPSPPLRSRPL